MQLEVRIERYADQGRCVAHIDGRVVFVRFALPGELVEIELDEPHNRKNRFATGEVVRVIEPSPYRVDPVWQLAGPAALGGGGVGGADLIHVSLPGQIEWKSTMVREQMERLGKVTLDTVPVTRLDCDTKTQGLYWRTRIEMVTNGEGRVTMRKRGTHVGVPIDTMPLASSALLEVAERYHVFDGGAKPNARVRLAVPEPREGRSIEDNFAWIVNDKLMAGTELVTERVSVQGREFTYKVHAGGFWQMHRMAPLVLVDYVLSLVQQQLRELRKSSGERAKNAPVLWELYSGSGLFTLPLAALATGDGTQPRIFTVEGARPAVEQARANAAAMGFDSIDAKIGDVAKTLRHVPREFAHPQVVVLDPPRAGAKAEVCRAIAASGAESVVYVACDPTSLARDTATLQELGYRLESIQAFDIYPHTHHVECVVLMSRVAPTK